MFKKPFKLAQSHSVSGKDRKSIRQTMQKLCFSEDAQDFLPEDI
jgi:predicted ribosome-associated RNA-binding protein Tma20